MEKGNVKEVQPLRGCFDRDFVSEENMEETGWAGDFASCVRCDGGDYNLYV